MNPQDYVWYAGYGSNLFRDRFLCYIVGGIPPGADEPNPGCKDKALPMAERPFIINHEFYFAKSSSKWQQGGIGFISTKSGPNAAAYSNIYLITKNQFCEVVQQETNTPSAINIDFDRAIQNGSHVFKEKSYYGNLLYVGDMNKYPIFTFTNERDITPVTRPSENYLKMITAGLLQTHHLEKDQLVNYLITRQGIANNYSRAQLEDIFNSVVKAQNQLT